MLFRDLENRNVLLAILAFTAAAQVKRYESEKEHNRDGNSIVNCHDRIPITLYSVRAQIPKCNAVYPIKTIIFTLSNILS